MEGEAMALTQTKKLTAEEFEKLGPEYERFELDEGELIEMPRPGEIHGDIAAELVTRLRTFAKEHRLGKVYVEIGYRLSDVTVRGPDLSFVRQERLAEPSEGFRPGAPDLAVEILSPHDYDHPGELLRKVGQDLDAGAQAVWVVDPRGRQVTIYGPGRFSELVSAGGVLRGEPVLPGFECPLAELFPESSG
jgi:Uma2 family endonuclease